MKKSLKGIFTSLAVLLVVAGISQQRADAALVAAICNDIACTGGDDFIITDNGAGDTIGVLGAVSFSTSAFGYSLLVNTSQSKPIIGSPTSPQLDLSYTVTSAGAVANPVFLYASDTDFVGSQSFLLTLGGTQSGSNNSIVGRAYGGTNNTTLTMTNLFATTPVFTSNAYSTAVGAALTPAVTPYSLTIGTAITRGSAGTTTGDLNLSAVPEPGAITLFGTCLLGMAAFMRRRNSGAQLGS